MATRWNKECQIWTLKEPITLNVPIKGINFNKGPLTLDENGKLEIKSGYSWNGCSPKFDILGMVFGTPEGALSNETEEEKIRNNLTTMGYGQFDWDTPKTYYASLIHDCLYQISEDYASQMDKKVADNLFFRILRAYGFLSAPLYYAAVRLFGKYSWGIRQ